MDAANLAGGSTARRPQRQTGAAPAQVIARRRDNDRDGDARAPTATADRWRDRGERRVAFSKSLPRPTAMRARRPDRSLSALLGSRQQVAPADGDLRLFRFLFRRTTRSSMS